MSQPLTNTFFMNMPSGRGETQAKETQAKETQATADAKTQARETQAKTAKSASDHLAKFRGGKIVCIEGNIGAGKSTVCKMMDEYLKSNGIETVMYPEPFNQKMLEQFLSNQWKYAYSFQLYMLTRRQVCFVQALQQKKEGKCCIIDRSLMGDYVFATVQVELGNMTKDEFEIYRDVYESFNEFKPDLTIFLEADVDVVINRIVKRDRNGEDKYNINYLNVVNNVYKREITRELGSPTTAPYVSVWNWNEDCSDEKVVKDKFVKKLKSSFN